MVVGLKIDFLWYPIGEGDFFHSFFSTICVNLENSKWGSKYPILMNDLYQGNLNVSKIDKALNELSSIEKEFKKLSIDKIIWDIDDLSKLPPWKDNVSPDINDLSEYFWTCNGENLFTVLKNAFIDSKEEKIDIEVEAL